LGLSFHFLCENNFFFFLNPQFKKKEKKKEKLSEYCLAQFHELHLTSDRQGTILLPSSSITPIELVPGI